MDYRHLFIDLDDTLWDTHGNNKACLRELYADYDFGRYYTSFDTFYQIFSPYNDMLWTKYRRSELTKDELLYERFRFILSPLGITDREQVLSINKDFLRRTTLKTGTVPGAMALLHILQERGFRMHILSNGFCEVQYLKMERAGLSPFFETVVLSEDAGVQKPDKAFFEYALARCKVRKEEVLMIGDSFEADIQGAHNAGIDQLWFNPKGEKPQGFTPTFEVERLTEISALLVKD